MPRHSSRCAFGLLPLAWAVAAHAHGGPAGITGIASADSRTASVVSTTEGLVQRDGERWRYICPIRFGNELSPPALSTNGGSTFVVGEEDLYALNADGSATAQGRPELARPFVVGLQASADRLYAVRFADGRTEVVPLEPPFGAPVWSDTTPYDSISPASEGFWAARVEATRGHAVHVDRAGVLVEARHFQVQAGDIVARVAEASGTLYVAILTRSLAGELLAIGPDGTRAVVAQTRAPVVGPILSGDRMVAGTDGALLELDGSSGTAAGTEEVTCLTRLGDTSYLCSRTKLFALAGATRGELLFDLATIEPPDLEKAPRELRSACSGQWTVFVDDLRAIGAVPAPVAPGTGEGGADPRLSNEASVSHGCGTAVAPSPFAGALACLALTIGAATLRRASWRRRWNRDTSRREWPRP